jgi:hypothetical protein
MFDILILSAEKDFNKIKFVYESINKNILNYNKIHCITNVPVGEDLQINDIQYHLDEDVLNFDFTIFQGNVRERTGWYKQQYIKLFQNVTISDYLVVDSDIFFNRKINIDSDNPSFFFGRDQHHEPYFIFMKNMLNLEKCYNYSFINEIMFFKREYINSMLKDLNVSSEEFFYKSAKIINTINHPSSMSEYELYGNYVTKNFPDSYNYVHIKTYLGGKYTTWKDDDILQYMKNFENTDYDIISMHTWV